jgi:hypothetical protein
VNLDYLLSRALEEHLMVLMDGIHRGAPEDYAGYRELVGEIRGIRYAMARLVDLRQQGGPDGDEIE